MESTESRRWKDVLDEELGQIKRRRPGAADPENDLVGLAISGGGIRSATFGLGVLEGLKKHDLLKRVDYLSTVSGGGYIGAWLSANCKRAPERKAIAKLAMDTADNEAAIATAAADKIAKARQASDAEKMAAAEKSANATAQAAEARKTFDQELEWLDENADWNRSIAHLRRYSNYLSPQLGLFSADTWSLLAIWIRNTLLVQVTVILAIALVLLAPRPLFLLFQTWPQFGEFRWATVALFVLGVAGIAGNMLRLNRDAGVAFLRAGSWKKGAIAAAICLGGALGLRYGFDFQPFGDGAVNWLLAAPIALLLVLTGFCLLPVAVKLMNGIWRWFSPKVIPPGEINYTQGWVQFAVVIPMMLTGYLMGAILWGQTLGVYQSPELAGVESFGGFFANAWCYWPLPLSVAAASLWLLSVCSVRRLREKRGWLVAILAPIPAVAVLYALMCAILLLLHNWAKDPEALDHGKWLAFIWAPTLVLFAFSLAIVMLIGIVGRQSTEGVREWWSRLGAWLVIYGIAWLLVAIAAVYGPKWAAFLLDSDTWKGMSVVGGWLLTTLGGLLAGNSDATGGGAKNEKSEKSIAEKLLQLLAIAGPFVFIAGLLIAVSTCLHLIMLNFSGQQWLNIRDLHLHHWQFITSLSPALNLTAMQLAVMQIVVMAAAAVLLFMMAARVDINEFSLNAFYRSRLSRCYLGATRYLPGQRTPQNFTGFDDDDDLPMADIGGAGNRRASLGPLHIVNCALNLGGSSDLTLHTRHSASFTFSPYAVGSNYYSSDPSRMGAPLGYRPTATYGGLDGQPTLGQAISVSGAAASPNMGYHTSPVVAFLLTVFNVRLGWWFPNPKESNITSPSPWLSLRYLVKELFGEANDKSRYLMISDGGHFENLAAYELIRRRCRVIIISDAECDPKLQFEGLGTLIRMCDVDSDIDAKIDIDVNALRPRAGSNWSDCRCAVGTIAYRDGSAPGVLIYLKASMTGNEDSAILQYKASHPDFPHEATANQFYGEDQFESYRRLGQEVADRTFAPASAQANIIAMSNALLEIWSPTLAHRGNFTQHSSRLMELWTQLGSSEKLQVLDKDYEKLLSQHWPDEQSPEAFRPAFYVCSQMIQLMENVYLDLDLEGTWKHPDNAGWRNLFEDWSRSAAIRKTWEVSAKTFGRRFQYFCNRNLNLPLPD